MRSPWAYVVLVGATAAAGCSTQGLAFRVDDRLDIVAPGDRAEVVVPFTIEWTVEDFDVTGPTPDVESGAGYFAVLVDRPPPPPGRTLESLFSGDEACAADPSCPDDAYLAARDVYVTSTNQVTVARLPDEGASAGGDLHEATVVLLDGHGRRIGESAFAVEFRVADDR